MEVQFAATPQEQDAQLREWGLEAGPLVEVVLWARGFYRDATSLYPGGWRFIHSYAKAGRRLRETHLTRGWVVCNLNNQTAIRHEGLKLRLHPSHFDDAAADPKRTPENLSDKGSAADTDTKANQQIDLFTYGLPQVVPQAEIEVLRGYTTLLLGIHFETEFARAEVSLPVRFLGGRFRKFLKRVPLLDGRSEPSVPMPKHDVDDVFGEVEILIKVVS